jgi:hypothetical protein
MPVYRLPPWHKPHRRTCPAWLDKQIRSLDQQLLSATKSRNWDRLPYQKSLEYFTANHIRLPLSSNEPEKKETIDDSNFITRPDIRRQNVKSARNISKVTGSLLTQLRIPWTVAANFLWSELQKFDYTLHFSEILPFSRVFRPSMDQALYLVIEDGLEEKSQCRWKLYEI